MKKILLLGGSNQQIVAIEKAKEMGLYTILCDYLPDNPGQYVADKFYLESTTDKDAILKISRDENIDGIIAYASDPAAPTAAYVAEKLSLPGNPYKSVNSLCNKDKFRKFLKDNDFNVPTAYSFSSDIEARNNISKFNFPIIIKPVDSSGSKGVTVLKSDKDIVKAIQLAFSFSKSHKIIIEDYIENYYDRIIGGDIFVKNGEIIIWGLMSCHRDNNVNNLVPVGKSFPVEIDRNDLDKVKETLRLLVNKLGILNGPLNVELIVNNDKETYLIDVGPRCGGNMIPDLISDIFNVDIVKMSIEAAMGCKIEYDIEKSDEFYAIYYLHSDKSGIYNTISFDNKLEPFIYRKCLYKNKGDKVEYFDNASKCLGIIFLKFSNRDIMSNILSDINKLIDVNLD